MPKLRAKDLAAAAEADAVAKASWFTVIRFFGRSPGQFGPITRESIRDRWDYRAEDYGASRDRALAEARRFAFDLRPVPFGRAPMIYAITDAGMTYYVETVGRASVDPMPPPLPSIGSTVPSVSRGSIPWRSVNELVRREPERPGNLLVCR